MTEKKDRDIGDVIDAILDIKEVSKSVRDSLKSLQRRYYFTPPEMMQNNWHEFQVILANDIGRPSGVAWKERVQDIFNGRVPIPVTLHTSKNFRVRVLRGEGVMADCPELILSGCGSKSEAVEQWIKVNKTVVETTVAAFMFDGMDGVTAKSMTDTLESAISNMLPDLEENPSERPI